MSKYSIYYNKQDEIIAWATIAKLEKDLGMKLDWVKIKRMNGDNIATVIGIMERQLSQKSK